MTRTRTPTTRLWNDLKSHSTVLKIKEYLPPLNFITIHYAYFILTCLLFSVIFWGSSSPQKSISYTDSLFLVVSAMTEAGLNTVNLSEMTTFQQVLLWLLIVTGSAIWVSIGTVWTRKRVFEKRFKGVVKNLKESRARRRSRSASASRGRGAPDMEVPVDVRLQEQRKQNEPVDKHEFESRHSGPRDPTEGQGEAGPVAVDGQSPDLGGREDAAQGTEGMQGLERGRTEGSTSTALEKGTELRNVHSRGRTTDPDRISIMQYAPSPSRDAETPPHRILNFVGVGAHPNSTAYKLPHSISLLNRLETKARNLERDAEREVENELDQSSYPHYLTRHTTGRNAQFYGLSRAEREHLGGVEYRAITLLGWVVPIYFVLWQLLGCLGLAAYMAHNKADVIRENGINPWWLGIFNGVSAFNNSGMSLLDANLIPFQTSVYTLITMGMMILAGNTAYPLILRLILWAMLKILCLVYPDPSVHSSPKSTLRFILLYPRRVYTNLFPSAPTWWLLFTVVTLNGIDWVAFELLNIGNAAVEAIPAHFRVLDGLFQALAVRSGGFYIISIPSLRIGLQVLYVIMMYISVYPVVITMRHSNVYEERSLGIYADDDDGSPSSSDDENERARAPTNLLGTFRRTLTSLTHATSPAQSTRAQFIRQQIRGQLAHDIWLLVLAVLFISCIEVSNFERDPVTYSVFNILFEVVSGYGCVGISTGLPNEAYSFSGGWKKSSKLILCLVMLRGRHRGLPVALDRAVRLPGQGAGGLGGTEEEDRVLRRARSMSVVGGGKGKLAV